MCDAHHHAPATETADAGDRGECPVMPGTMVDKEEAVADGLYRDYEGTRYYLCCDSCGPMFDADPARYAAV